MLYNIPDTYNFGMTYYRNFYQNRIAGGVAGSKSIRVLKKHLEHTSGTAWYAANQELLPGEDLNLVDLDTPVLCTSAMDIDGWLKAEVNDDTIECKVSFICSLVKETGIMSQEDLDIFIDHKQNYVRKTDRGKKIVAQYHKLGAVLQRKMEQDLYRYKVYQHLYDTWLANVVQCIKDEKYEEAEKLYLEAISYLAKRYNMEDKVNDFAE